MVKRKTRANKSRKRGDKPQRPLTKTKTKSNARKKKPSKKKNSKGAAKKTTSPRKPAKRTKSKIARKKTSVAAYRKSKRASAETKNPASSKKAKKQARSNTSKVTRIVFGANKSKKPSRPRRYFSKRGRPPSLDRARRTIAEVDEPVVESISKPSNTGIKTLENKKRKEPASGKQEGLFKNYVERLRRHVVLGE
tara:strand:+ start:406 stop:987 length:582 start_codon:yes stop_codon:yes gene_type:complete